METKNVSVSLPTLPDGRLVLPSVFPGLAGKSRSEIPLDRSALADNAVAFLVAHEAVGGGFERPHRAFFDTHLAPGDAFIDVGAHWGVFSLDAATKWPGQVKVLSLEPLPSNLNALAVAIAHNGLGDSIEVIACACGDTVGSAPLVLDGSMTGSLHGHGLAWLGSIEKRSRLTVPVLPLDLLIEERPQIRQRRLMVKIDAEGSEPEVIRGLARALEERRVAALTFERGKAFASPSRRDALRAAMATLRDFGYALRCLVDETDGGHLIDAPDDDSERTIIALSPAFGPTSRYERPPTARKL